MKGGLVLGAKVCRSAGFLGRGEGQCQGWDHCQGLTMPPATHTHTSGKETTLENFKGNWKFTNCPNGKESVATLSFPLSGDRLKVNPPQCYQPGGGLRQAPERVTADQPWGGQVPPSSPPPPPFGLPLTPSCNDFVAHVHPLQPRVLTQGGHAWDRAHGS